jgi:TRAP-type C4-dicarboxylate transport system substrate-binding protein
MKRSAVLLGIIGAMVIGLLIVQPVGAQMVLKVPCDQPPGEPNYKNWKVFEQVVESLSQGQIQVEVHPSAALGTTESATEAGKMGLFKVWQGDEGIVGAYAPFMVWMIPYVFSDEMVMYKWFQSDHFRKINEQMAKEIGIRTLAGAPYGNYCFFNKQREIKKLEDLKGLKFRIMPNSQIMGKTYEGLGLSPTPVAWTELYTGMKTGVIDGLSHALFVFPQQKLYEVGKYLTLDFSFAGANTVMVNEKWWNAQPENYKAIFQEAANLGTLVEMGASTYDNRVTAIGELEKSGVKVSVLDPKEKLRIKEAAQKAAIGYIEQEVGKQAVDDMLSAVAEIEKQLGIE